MSQNCIKSLLHFDKNTFWYSLSDSLLLSDWLYHLLYCKTVLFSPYSPLITYPLHTKPMNKKRWMTLPPCHNWSLSYWLSDRLTDQLNVVIARLTICHNYCCLGETGKMFLVNLSELNTNHLLWYKIRSVFYKKVL